MYKKLISSILVVALLNLLGCYSSELINAAEYNQIEEKDKPNEIYVIANEKEYHFTKIRESNFYIDNDTLYGKAEMYSGTDNNYFTHVKIALSDIESVEGEYLNGGLTALLSAGILVALVALAVGIFSVQHFGL